MPSIICLPKIVFAIFFITTRKVKFKHKLYTFIFTFYSYKRIVILKFVSYNCFFSMMLGHHLDKIYYNTSTDIAFVRYFIFIKNVIRVFLSQKNRDTFCSSHVFRKSFPLNCLRGIAYIEKTTTYT